MYVTGERIPVSQVDIAVQPYLIQCNVSLLYQGWGKHYMRSLFKARPLLITNNTYGSSLRSEGFF